MKSILLGRKKDQLISGSERANLRSKNKYCNQQVIGNHEKSSFGKYQNCGFTFLLLTVSSGLLSEWFASREHLAVSGGSIQWVETRDTAKCPKMNRITSHNKVLLGSICPEWLNRKPFSKGIACHYLVLQRQNTLSIYK